ncbi:hypothetical protein CISIN_1g039773mg, partial [Citrus sinensis]
MASALESLCGKAFGAKKYYMLGVYMQRSSIENFAYQFPPERFLQCQLKNMVIAWVSLVALLLHILLSWLLVYRVQFGVIGTAISLNFPWWLLVLGLFGYVACGGCPLTWTGFWEFIKLSAASGVMLLWDTLILMIGNLNNSGTALDALSI